MIKGGMNIARFEVSNGEDSLNDIEISLNEFRAAVDGYNEELRNESSLNLRSDEEGSIRFPAYVGTVLDPKGCYYETGFYNPIHYM